MPLEFSEIVSSIDLNLVASEILHVEEGEKEVDEWSFDEAKKLVWLAGEKWLVRDLENFTLEEVEGVRENTSADFTGVFKYVIDVLGKVKEGAKKPFDEFKNSPYVIDWKTSKNTLDTNWRKRLINSWQWQDYAHFTGAKIVIYRGISRTETTSEIIIRVPESNDKEVIQLLSAVGGQIEGLRNLNLEVWPQNKPFACGAYGRECEFLKDCEEYSMPKGNPPFKNMSYSYLNNFMLCNEKGRRMAFEGEKETTEEAAFGKAVHRSLASMWSQAFALYGN